MKAQLVNKMEQIISNIASVKVTLLSGSDGVFIAMWDGENKKPFDKLQKVLGSRVYNYDVDNEDGFLYSGCLVNLNSK